MSEHDVAEKLAGVAAELAGVAKALDALTEKVGIQNGRISRLESKAAGQEGISIGRTRTEIAVETKLESMESACEAKMVNMDERVRNLETSRAESRGGRRGRSETLRDGVMIVTLLSTLAMAGWQVLFSHPAPAPAVQHQAK